MEQVDVVLVARVCHLVWWQLCKLLLRLPLPDLATVDSLLKITLRQSTMSDYPLGTYATVKVCQFSAGPLFNLSDCIQHLHKIVPAFTPYVPVGVLSYLAFILLTATFGLAFYFTTCVIITPFYALQISSNLSAASQNRQSLCVRQRWLL